MRATTLVNMLRAQGWGSRSTAPASGYAAHEAP